MDTTSPAKAVRNGVVTFSYFLILAWAVWVMPGCGNDPYPKVAPGKKVYYSYMLRSYPMDPVSTQDITALSYLGCICESLFEYHYLKRPAELQPLLAKAVPSFEEISEPASDPNQPARTLYRLRFEIWDQVLFHRDVCFDEPGYRVPKTRELTADDFAFTFMRIADPANNCPTYDGFTCIDGLTDWSRRIEQIRQAHDEEQLTAQAFYNLVGPIPGVRVTGRYSFDLLLKEKYPILMYWLAFTTTAPVPPEAVEYYDGTNGRKHLREWPVGTGPYKMAAHDKDEYVAMERNLDWRGITQPERNLPGTHYPTEGEPTDRQSGLLDPEYVGRSLPFIDRYEYRRDRETVSQFGRFLQGYYDAHTIDETTFHQAVSAGELTPELEARGIDLVKAVQLRVWYFAFNMDDDIVGSPPVFKDPRKEKDHDLWIERNRKLRQAMNLAHDSATEIAVFMNGRALKAESPLPPGVFGYDPQYRNPYRQYDPDLKRARQLLAEAGYPNGIDPRTGRPLRIELSGPGIDARDQELYKMNVRLFGRLGINVDVDVVTDNAYRRKLREGAFQVARWGWYADYPDPQTFLLLLYGPERCTGTGRNNKANFKSERYDFLYDKMVRMENDESATWTELDQDGQTRKITMSRYQIIREMIAIFEHECPWIVNHHPQAWVLFHHWYHNMKPGSLVYNVDKYLDINQDLRREKRAEWNPPVYWPLYAFIIALVTVIAPAVRTYLRKTRQ